MGDSWRASYHEVPTVEHPVAARYLTEPKLKVPHHMFSAWKYFADPANDVLQ